MKHAILTFILFFGGLISVAAQNVPPPPPISDSAEIRIFTKVDVEASFPGGEPAWRTYLTQNLNIDKISRKIKIPRDEKFVKETIIVKFIVSKDGSISDVSAENTDANHYCIAEAERVIKISPRWIPAQQNKRKVNAYRRQPITFLFER